MSKLQNIPKIYYINLKSAVDRNQYMLDMFKRNGITNFERFEAKKPRISGNPKMSSRSYGCMMSHIYVLSKIANADDKYAIVVEDDIDIDVVEKWDFSWNEFMSRLPEFDIVQLSRHQYAESWRRGNPERTGTRFKVWDNGDVCTTGYLVTKEYAKKIVDLFKKDPIGLTGFKNFSEDIGPVSDFALYDGFNTYSTCIFGFQNFPSQIANPHVVFDPFIDNFNYMKSLFDEKISINDIFSKQEMV